MRNTVAEVAPGVVVPTTSLRLASKVATAAINSRSAQRRRTACVPHAWVTQGRQKARLRHRDRAAQYSRGLRSEHDTAVDICVELRLLLPANDR